MISMTVYYQVTYRLEAFHIGFPVVRTDVRSRDDQNFLDG